MMKHFMMWKRVFVVLVFPSSFAFNLAHAGKIETGFLDRQITLREFSYRYQVYVPVDYVQSKPHPVVLFLHSAGERGEDGILQTQVGLGPYLRQDRKRFPFIVVFPQARGDEIWTGVMTTLALKALDRTMEEFNTDPERIYVTGISMGGHGTWYMATQAPEKFAAMVPICGFVAFPRPDLPEQRKANLRRMNPLAEHPDPYVFVASQITKIPVWIFHGSADLLVLPDESRKMFEVLQASGGDVKYTEYEGVAHNAWDKAYSEPDLVPWLLSHRRRQQ